jgi:hypothetical protein
MTQAQNGGRKIGSGRLEQMSDMEQRHALYRGVTISDMEIIFKKDRRTILSRLTGVKPVGKRGQADIFAIIDVAPHLVKPVGDMGEFIKKARPQDLPPFLQKEYWNGLRSKQAFMLADGQLWRTERVAEVLSETFKTLRTELLLIPDELERKTALSDSQREEVRALIDVSLENLRVALTEQFNGEPGAGDGPGVYSGEDADPAEGVSESGDEDDGDEALDAASEADEGTEWDL